MRFRHGGSRNGKRSLKTEQCKVKKARCAWNRIAKRCNNFFGKQEPSKLCNTFTESLILAQDERWRRA